MRPSSGPVLGRPLVFSSLFGLYLLAFVITPLWTRFPGLTEQAVALGVLTAAGMAWAWVSSGSFRLAWKPVLPAFTGFLLLAAALNARAMAASLPWRGDEGFHVDFVADLAEAFAARPWYLAMPLLPLALGGYRKTLSWTTWFGALALTLLAAYIALTAHLRMDNYSTWYHIMRYPILLKYLAAVPVYLWSWLPASWPPEIPYRILPLVSAAALAALAVRRLRRYPFGLRYLAGIAVLTLPLIRYYSSILYLEMPAVLCMTWAAFHADRLLRADPDRLTSAPAWYALLMVGFLKETTLPFLIAFIACRALARFTILWRRRSLNPATLLRETGVFYGVGLPLFLYLCFRSHFGDPRPVALWLTNLKDLHLPLRLAHSFADGFTMMLLPAVAGLFLRRFSRRRRWLPRLFLFSAAGLSVALHYLDDYNYIGYSRFNLFLVPSLLALAWPALGLVASRRQAYAAGFLAALILVNLSLSPILSDGNKKTLWGIYGGDTGEHYYPYREALRDLMKGHAGQKALLAGHYYGYSTGFYTGDRDWPEQWISSLEPADEGRRMDSTLAAAAASGYQAVLYHQLGKDYREPGNLHGYGNIQVYKNQAHTLVLFSR